MPTQRELEDQPNDSNGLILAYHERSFRRMEAVLRLYVIIGALVALIGMLYFVYLTYGASLELSQQMALILAGAGILTSAFSLALLRLRRERMRMLASVQQGELLRWQFLKEWARLEASAKAALGEYSEEVSRHSIRSVLEHLSSNNVLDKATLASVGQALLLRNEVAHGRERVPDIVVQEMIAVVRRAREKIEST